MSLNLRDSYREEQLIQIRIHFLVTHSWFSRAQLSCKGPRANVATEHWCLAGLGMEMSCRYNTHPTLRTLSTSK